MTSISDFYDDWENTPILIPMLKTRTMALYISTYKSDSTILWGEGSKSTYGNIKMNDYTLSNTQPGISTKKTYPELFTGDIKVFFKLGASDVYSINFHLDFPGSGVTTQYRYNIINLKTFLSQFPKLYSINYRTYAYGDSARQVTIKGNLIDVPASVRRIRVYELDLLSMTSSTYIDFDALTPEHTLEYYRHEGIQEGYGGTTTFNGVYIKGDIAKLPPTMSFFYYNSKAAQGTNVITYTPGKTWRSDFDTFRLNKQLSANIIDNILVDMNNSITTAIGGKLIYLRGSRTVASEVAVLGLQNKGFTVSITA